MYLEGINFSRAGQEISFFITLLNNINTIRSAVADFYLLTRKKIQSQTPAGFFALKMFYLSNTDTLPLVILLCVKLFPLCCVFYFEDENYHVHCYVLFINGFGMFASNK